MKNQSTEWYRNTVELVAQAACRVVDFRFQPLGLILVALVCLSSVKLGAQQANPEAAELRVALQFTQQKLADLQQQLAQATEQKRASSEALAQAVRISEEKSFKATEVQEKLEAYGVDLITSSEDSLQKRLLKAVRDLDIVRQENERQRNAVHQLSESFLKYIAKTPGATQGAKDEAQDSIAKAGRSLRALVEPGQVVSRPLEKSRIVSVDSKIGLVVLDAGRQSGVRVGTPITVRRNESAIYTALIVDVRDSISGALLQERLGKANTVQVGDKVFPLATRNTF